jgi:hypothetical protein
MGSTLLVNKDVHGILVANNCMLLSPVKGKLFAIMNSFSRKQNGGQKNMNNGKQQKSNRKNNRNGTRTCAKKQEKTKKDPVPVDASTPTQTATTKANAFDASTLQKTTDEVVALLDAIPLQTTATVDTSIPRKLPEEMEEQADASETLAQDDVPELPRDWKELADVTRRNTRAEKVAAEKEAAKEKAKNDKKAAAAAKLAERKAKEEGAQFGNNARSSRTNSFKGAYKGHKGYNSWGDTSKMTAHLRQEYVCGKYA